MSLKRNLSLLYIEQTDIGERVASSRIYIQRTKERDNNYRRFSEAIILTELESG